MNGLAPSRPVFSFPLEDDTKETRQFERTDWPTWKRVRPCPFRDPTLEDRVDRRENGIIIAKMKPELRSIWNYIYIYILYGVFLDLLKLGHIVC